MVIESVQLEQLISTVADTIADSIMHIQPPLIKSDVDIVCNKIFEEARSRIARRRNTEVLWHPFAQLPVEICTICFELLGIYDRIAVSQVCSHWRSVALSHRVLWNKVSILELRSDLEWSHYHAPDYSRLVENISQRSAPLPFYLDCSGWESNDAMCQLVSQNVHRFAQLLGYFRGDWNDLLLRSPVPEMLDFRCLSLSLATLQSFARVFPQLHHLDVERLDIPETFDPILTVRHLECSATTEDGEDDSKLVHSDFRRLFDMFPLLEELTLSTLHECSLLPRALPPSLRYLNIYPYYEVGNLAPLIRRWSRRHWLRRLTTSCLSGSSFAAVIEFLMASIGDSTVSIEVHHGPAMKLVPHRDGLCVTVGFYPPANPAQLSPILDRLTHMTVACEGHLSRLAAVAYDALTDLVVHACSDCRQYGVRPFLDPDSTIVLRVPQLRRLTYRFDLLPFIDDANSSRWNVRGTLQIRGERLDSIKIISSDTERFNAHDWSYIFDFTDELIYEHPTDPEKFHIFHVTEELMYERPTKCV